MTSAEVDLLSFYQMVLHFEVSPIWKVRPKDCEFIPSLDCLNIYASDSRLLEVKANILKKLCNSMCHILHVLYMYFRVYVLEFGPSNKLTS